MNKMYAAILSRACTVVILALLIPTASVRASIILGDPATTANLNEAAPVNAAATKAVSSPATSSKKASIGNPPAETGPDTIIGDVSLLEVLLENVDPTAARVKTPNIDPGKLASSIRPDDADPGRPSPLKDPGAEVLDEDGSVSNQTADIVFAGSQ